MEKNKIGITTSSDCPRSGYIMLWNKFDQRVTLPTKCKTWRCSGCRDRIKAVVKARMVSGCSALGRCYLITLTYQSGKGIQQDAVSVRRDWTRLLRQLKERSPRIAWFRIIEITKKNQPHLHLIVGGLGNRKDACRQRDSRIYTVDWFTGGCADDCLVHEWAKQWFDVTGESFVVDAILVHGAAGAGAYLTKYLTKGLIKRDALMKLGFLRLFSTSRNWPGLEKMQLARTERGEWIGQTFVYADRPGGKEFKEQAERDRTSPMARRVGTPLAEYFGEQLRRSKGNKVIRKVMNSAIDREASVPEKHSDRS